jgi:squalene-hopene/tetraprenyl-beta-curcumene cyclase
VSLAYDDRRLVSDVAVPGARDALDCAVEHLRSRQDAAGWWKGELETNVTMDAEDLLMREFLGIRTAEVTDEAARWIRSQQRDDGTWANYFGGPGDLSTTVEAYVALRLAGDTVDAPHMAAALRFIRDGGGLEQCRVFTRLWMSLFGVWSWDDVPNLPPEIVYLPSWFPFNLYDWACWARQTIVPLTIVATLRPQRPLPFSLDEIKTGSAPEPMAHWRTTAGAFQRLDKVLHRYARRPARALRTAAMRKGIEWILDRQEADGSWGGIQPPWVYSILALHLMGYPLDHPAVAAAIRGLDAFVIREPTADGTVRRLEACRRTAGRRLAGRRGDPGRGRLAGTPSRRCAGRMGVRVRERRVSGHRRHGGDRARAASGARRRSDARSSGPWSAVAGRDAVSRRRLGRL